MAKLKLRPAEVGPTGRAVACSKMRGLAPFGGRRRGQDEAATGATIGHALFVLIEEPIMLRLRGPLEKHAGRGLVRKQLSNGLASSRRRSTSGEKRHGDRRRRAREGLIRIPGEGLGLDSCAVAKRVGWCAMSRGGRPWRELLVI